MTEPPDLTPVAASICASQGLSLGEPLGSGAFKRVYRVEDQSGTSLALKVLREPTLSERTRREADALARCDHSNIARLHRVDTHNFRGSSYTFILEEYLRGGSLTSRVRNAGTPNLEIVLSLGRKLIDALAYLARLKLVHRDIKPDNIMFREDESTPVLVDFGLVRNLMAPSLTHTWADRGPGTPYFAAPEQLNNQKRLIDWRTDQFSLGVVLAFTRFGRHPYQDDDEPPWSSSTVERVANRGPRSTTFFAGTVRDNLQCLRPMTSAWPVQRIRRPADLAEAWGRQEAAG